MGPGMQAPLEAGKGKEMDFPLGLLEGTSPDDTLRLGSYPLELRDSTLPLF